ncbi:MAG TPA: FKBP-type peptidyl-prolyl cis-trans isomerase [Bacteroidota bacterium]
MDQFTIEPGQHRRIVGRDPEQSSYYHGRSGVMRVLVVAALAFVTIVSGSEAQKKTAIKTEKQKVSYGIGLTFAKNMKQQSLEIDQDALIRGLKDGLSGAKPAMTEKEVADCMTAFQKDMVKKRSEKAAALAEKNKKEGEAFLAANKSKEGVITTASGLQYKILKEGTGPKPTPKDTVRCNYSAKLLDGKEVDSSYKRGEPAEFVISQVIPGWTEALQLMPVGSKWELYVPSNLAYAERGAGQDIGPNATMIFEVELLGIK